MKLDQRADLRAPALAAAPAPDAAAAPARSSPAPQSPPLLATPTGAWRRLAEARAPGVPPQARAAHAVERRAQLELLARTYYPAHPRLHLCTDGLDLSRVGAVGRVDETSRLEKIVLGMPHALDGEWRYSPITRKQGATVDLHQALAQHATLAKFLLERGVEVFLVAHPDAASEAVYATDVVTGFGPLALVGNPDAPARRLEATSYRGGVALASFAGRDAPIEFGDVALAFDRCARTLRVVQGVGSERSTDASAAAMERALRWLGRKLDGVRIEHVPIRLSGSDTLHLDFVANYAGRGDSRAMVVYPKGLADPGDVERLARAFGVRSDARIVTIDSHDAMMRGAAVNFSSLDPKQVMIARNAYTAPTIEALERLGFTVHALAYDQMTRKDGSLHCTNGQLKRAMP